MKQKIAIFVALGVASANSLAMTRRDDRTDAQYLNYGSLFPSVGQVWAGNSWTGSGTLVGSNWVLTAAHVSDTFSNNGRVNLGGNFYNVAQVFTNPGWSGNLTTGTDLALLRLANPVNGIAPMPIYYGSNYVGRAASVVGYGGTGTGSGGWTGTYDMQKRGGTNTIDALNFTFNGTPFQNTAVMDFDNPAQTKNTLAGLGSSATPTNLEMNVIFGDSGGALLVDESGTTMLTGVTSWLWNTGGGNTGAYGDLSGFTAIYGQRNWIRSIVPEPATIAAFGALLPMLLRRRKK